MNQFFLYLDIIIRKMKRNAFISRFWYLFASYKATSPIDYKVISSLTDFNPPPYVQ